MKYFLIVITFCILLLSCSGQTQDNSNANENEHTPESKLSLDIKSFEWLNDKDSDYKISEVNKKQSAYRIFKVDYNHSSYILKFEINGEKTTLIITLENKIMWKGEIEILTTLRIGSVLVEEKQELWLETAENRPKYFNIKLSPTNCTVEPKDIL